MMTNRIIYYYQTFSSLSPILVKDTVVYHMCDTVPFKPSTNGGSTDLGNWTVDPIEKAEILNGELLMKDSGSVMVYYKTPGACFAIDSLAVIIREADTAEIDMSVHDVDKVDNDTIKFCLQDTSFQLVLTLSSTIGGTWSTRNESTSTDISATDSNGNFKKWKCEFENSNFYNWN